MQEEENEIFKTSIFDRFAEKDSARRSKTKNNSFHASRFDIYLSILINTIDFHRMNICISCFPIMAKMKTMLILL